MYKVTVTEDDRLIDAIEFDDADVIDRDIVQAGIMREVARPQLWYRVAAAAEWIAAARLLMAVSVPKSES